MTAWMLVVFTASTLGGSFKPYDAKVYTSERDCAVVLETVPKIGGAGFAACAKGIAWGEKR